nr:MAG TPA: hypothetical protein [Caudoviricetes sp.]
MDYSINYIFVQLYKVHKLFSKYLYTYTIDICVRL